ncbi:MAG TPA: hypothetical protein V6D35_22655 [Candidatus Sericytochromatia bacterium]|jgi:hypothetical protein
MTSELVVFILNFTEIEQYIVLLPLLLREGCMAIQSLVAEDASKPLTAIA